MNAARRTDRSPMDPKPEPSPAADRPTQIGVIAERLGLSIRTLHHWEEMGLVTPSARSAGGFRLYTEDDVGRLITVRRMKPLGFTLEEMKGLLEAIDSIDSGRGDAEAIQQARTFIAECHRRAEDRCRELHERLSWAEEFRDALAHRIGRDRD